MPWGIMYYQHTIIPRKRSWARVEVLRRLQENKDPCQTVGERRTDWKRGGRDNGTVEKGGMKGEEQKGEIPRSQKEGGSGSQLAILGVQGSNKKGGGSCDLKEQKERGGGGDRPPQGRGKDFTPAGGNAVPSRRLSQEHEGPVNNSQGRNLPQSGREVKRTPSSVKFYYRSSSTHVGNQRKIAEIIWERVEMKGGEQKRKLHGRRKKKKKGVRRVRRSKGKSTALKESSHWGWGGGGRKEGNDGQEGGGRKEKGNVLAKTCRNLRLERRST